MIGSSTVDVEELDDALLDDATPPHNAAAGPTNTVGPGRNKPPPCFRGPLLS